MKKSLVAITLFLLAWTPAKAQSQGRFTPVFAPKVKAELPAEVNETSGLFYYNGRLWTHNDSGGKPILYGIDTVDFNVVQKITLANAENKDWEDVCTDGVNVFVGDFGNNKGARNNLKIHVFPLSSIPEQGDATVKVETISFSFGDQTDFGKRKVHDFDCEAIFATERSLYLLSKGWETGTTRLYRLPKTPGKHVAEVVNGFDSQGLVTGADYDRETSTLVVVGYVKSLWKPFIYLVFDFDDAGVKLPHHRFELPSLLGCQTEGVCFVGNGKCYVSAETSKAFSARVFELDFGKWMQNQKNR